MRFDPQAYPYPSRRQCVYGKGGMIAASHPLASSAGLRLLAAGGNAVDAAVAAAAMLTVAEPASNGIGGDLFALVWQRGRLYGLNASGRAPQRLSCEALRQKGWHKDELPRFGWETVTMPGAPAGWLALLERFGSKPAADVFAPAIAAAEDGIALSAEETQKWQDYARLLHGSLPGLEEGFFQLFTKQGAPYQPGDIFRSPGHSRMLRQLAAEGADAFYHGAAAEALLALSQKTGGYFTADDFTASCCEWVAPLHIDYRGYQIWELPPNGQGVAALLALNILKGFPFAPHDFGKPETLHLQIEAMKLAFADAAAFVADPECMSIDTAALLSDEYATARRACIDKGQSQRFAPGTPPPGGTVYFAAADADTMVSLIQSNYQSFGSGIVLPEFGLALHSRGACFSLQPGHPNQLRPGRRPYHTIIPAFISQDGAPVGPFGLMGQYMQPQGHVQLVMNCIDFAMNPQAALDAPRWCWQKDLTVALEPGFSAAAYEHLQHIGHQLCYAPCKAFGRGQIIQRHGNALIGGAEPRSDSCICVC